jgi:hypothetical protein
MIFSVSVSKFPDKGLSIHKSIFYRNFFILRCISAEEICICSLAAYDAGVWEDISLKRGLLIRCGELLEREREENASLSWWLGR